MNPHSAFDELVQRQSDACQPSLAHREWERMDRQLREMERIDRMAREMDRVARIATETALLRARAEIAMRRVFSQTFVNSLVRTQQVLLQHTMRAVEQQAFLSRMNDVFLRQAEFARTIASVTERIVGETALHAGLVSRLMSAYRAIPSEIVTINYDALLNVVMQGFEETGLTESEVACQTILWRFEAWLDKFPPNVRNIVIAFIFTILGAVGQEALHSYRSGSKALLPAHCESQYSSAAAEHADANFDMCR
jgi:hypothetical protein